MKAWAVLLAASGALSLAGCGGDRADTDATSALATAVRLSGDVDRHAVAVMPFQVASSDSALLYLREGIPELLSQALNFGSPVRADLDAETTLEARRQALDAGLGQVVTGTVLGEPESIVIQASVRRTLSGRVMAEESIQGPLDSLAAMTSRLALELLMRGDADPAIQRMIASVPIEAVEATVQGVAALRRFEWNTAHDRFDAAIAVDSTFTPAVYGLYETVHNPTSTVAGGGREVDSLTWSLYDRLPAAFRAWLDASRGAEGGRKLSGLERLARWERAAEASPNHPGIWDRLFYWYYWHGEYLGIEDWERQARNVAQQWADLLDLEVNCEALEHLLPRQIDPDPADVAAFRDHCRRWEEAPNPGARVFLRLHKAYIVGDTVEVALLRNGGARDSLGGILGAFIFYWVQEGHPLGDWAAAIEAADREATTRRDRVDPRANRYHFANLTGHPSEAMAQFDELLAQDTTIGPGSMVFVNPWFWAHLPIVHSLGEPGWEAAAAEAQRMLENPDPAWGDTLPDGNWNNSFERLCFPELARVGRGDTAQVRSSVDVLRQLRDSLFVPREERSCPELLEAMVEQMAPGAGTEALSRLDSLMRRGPMDDDLDQKLTNLLMARMYWARGDTAKAWHWVKRRRWFTAGGQILAPWLRSRGRFAVAVGEREEALRAYRHYLMLREDPEPVLVPQRDSVRAELACIDSELADRRDPALCAELLGEAR